MEQALVKYLESNKDLYNYIENRIYPGFSKDISKPSITYRIKRVQEGTLKESQLTLILLDKEYDECLEIENILIDLLHTMDNKPNIVVNNVAFRGSLSGGGPLFNVEKQMWEDNLIFIMKWRYVNE